MTGFTEEIIIEQDSTIIEPEPKQEMIVKEEKVIEPEIVRIETDKLICYKEDKKNNLKFSWNYKREEKKELFLFKQFKLLYQLLVILF